MMEGERMVKAECKRTESGTLVLVLEGHAGSAPEGEDLICAAASILAYTAAQEVREMEKAGKLRKRPRVELAKGLCRVTCTPRTEAQSEALHTYKVVQTGLRLLAESFPEQVALKTF